MSYSNSVDHHGNLQRGVSNLNRTYIQWRGTEQPGVEPIEVINATLIHLQHLQKTRQASDTNSRLIWHLMQAQEEYSRTKGNPNGHPQGNGSGHGSGDGLSSPAEPRSSD